MSCSEVVALSLVGLLVLSAIGFLSQLGGWTTLARHYRRLGTVESGLPWRHVVLGYVGWLNYNNCLSVAASSTGFHLTAYFPFRLGHPPLFFPWEDVSARELSGVFRRYTEFKFAKEPKTAVYLTSSLGRTLLADAGRLGRPGSIDVE